MSAVVRTGTNMNKYRVFWDEADVLDLCMVPCWPVDAAGDAVDCEDGAVIVGVLGIDPQQHRRVSTEHVAR